LTASRTAPCTNASNTVHRRRDHRVGLLAPASSMR
jgi:hypothetical protein